MQLNPSRTTNASDDAEGHEAIEHAIVASKSSALHRENAFGRLPMSVARDTRLSAVELVLLTHRTSFTKGFVPKEHIAQRIVKGGLGKDTVRRAIARLRSEESPQANAKRLRKRDRREIEPELLGYLHRRQIVDPNGRFVRVREELRLPTCRRPRLVPRTWFDGRLSVKALAALIYIQAGTDGGGQPYVREIAERFGWTRQTAQKAVGELVEVGLVVDHQDRRQGGRFAGTRYGLKDRKTVDVNRVKNNGNGATGNGQSGNILRKPLYELSSRETFNARTSESYASREREAVTLDHLELETDAFCSPNLLGWIEDKPIEDTLFNVSDDTIWAICAVADDQALRRLMREATGGRVSREIMSAAGLAAIRRLAAFALDHPSDEDGFTPHQALSYVLDAIRDRIGNQPGSWLNSLAVIGLRILWSGYGGDGVEDAPYRSQCPRQLSSPGITAELNELKAADGARVIAPQLYQDAKGLENLIEKFGTDALDTIKAKLVGAMIDGSKVGKIKSWSYFREALDDERRAAELKAQGMRPGDCPGWRQASRANSDRGAADA
jgi:hypothetical protein